MVDIKVGGPASTSKTPEKKKTSRPSAGGPSFASLLEETDAAGEASEVRPPSVASGVPPVTGHAQEDDQPAPRDSKTQARDLIEGLQTLAEDVLASQPSKAAGKLEAYLNAEVTDRSDLSAEAQQVLDELSTRAAVAAAKATDK